jgi:hypothetical protein
MKKHHIWMILGCIVPLVFIFLAPLFGITGSLPLLGFIFLMFAVHLLMPMHHDEHHHDEK